MQLSDLLARLTAAGLATVLDRRLGPNAAAIDEHALANQLANPASIAAALGEINNGQLALLRWLATRPNLQARWTELSEAIGDRLTPELRDGYLNDLS